MENIDNLITDLSEQFSNIQINTPSDQTNNDTQTPITKPKKRNHETQDEPHMTISKHTIVYLED